MAGAGSGGFSYSAGFRYSRLSCTPALAMAHCRPKCTASLYAGCEPGLVDRDCSSCERHAHILLLFFLIPQCSSASCISSSDLNVFFACLAAPWPILEAEEEEELVEEEWVARASSWSNATTVDRVNVVISYILSRLLGAINTYNKILDSIGCIMRIAGTVA